MSRRPRRSDPTKSDPELLTRTSWVNANLAYRQIKRGRAEGNTCALWLRLHLQNYLFGIGCFIQEHCGKVAFLGVLLLSLCCIGLKYGHLETNVNELWVEKGGRLEKELEYVKTTIGEGSGTTFQLIIQTPKTGVSLLQPESVLLHYEAVLAATQITVNVDGIPWTFRDLCLASHFPVTEQSIVDSILDGILPCILVTPIDCFWEGAKLLGPDPPVITGGIHGMPNEITWANLNPQTILQKLDNQKTIFPVDALRDVFKRAGITTAYQEKPCLNPKDPQCPKTSPNYNGSVPDIGAVFTKGCRGFASKYMAWEPELIFGGIKRNKSGHIVRVEAFQTILQLMEYMDLYSYYVSTNKVAGIDWTHDKAKHILESFQRKFSNVVNNFGGNEKRDEVFGFTYTSLMDIMQHFSRISVSRVVIGYVIMFVYACVSMLRWTDPVRSQSGIGMAGVVLVSLSVAAGLGACSVLRISFNASTTQIIPFLALGLGVDDMFLIAHCYFENADKISGPELTGEVLKRTGVTVLLTSISNILAFSTAAIIPIPALRAFTLQAAILVLFNLVSVLLVYPAIVSLDMVRREDKRIDVLCCFQSAGANEVMDLRPQPSHDECEHRAHTQHELTDISREASPPPPYSYPGTSPSGVHQPPCYDTVTRSTTEGPVTSLAPNDKVFLKRCDLSSSSVCPSTTSSRQCLTPESGISCKERCIQAQKECFTWTLTGLAKSVYAPFLQRTFVKVTVITAFLIFLVLGAWGTAQVKDGLDLTDLVPKNTPEFEFLQAQSKYFGFYSINAVTKDNFDYPNNQQLLYQYHQNFQRVDKVIKKEDGTLPNFWLDLFRQWLADLQVSFDRDYSRGLVSSNGWMVNASEETILAYKLLIQTGNDDNPVNKEQVTRIRLVDDHGNIYPPAFYNYLSAWASNDAVAYAASMANFHPEPAHWFHDPTDYNYRIEKSKQLVYTQLPFYITNISSTEEVIDVINEIRSICDKFSDKGLPNFPSGVPFTFYEQYIDLRYYLMISLICVLSVTFVVFTVILMNPWIAFIVVLILSMILVELFGFMGLMGIKLSAVPAVILIMVVGIGVEFTLHVSVGFLTAIGSRDKRVAMSLEHTFAPVIHGAASTFLGILMLVGTEFEFIIIYFFNVLAALVVIGLFNGLMLLPVILSVFGPRGEVIPKDNGDELPIPTPEPSPKMERRSSTRHQRFGRRDSLSTISEEPTQYSSHEIIVQPEVVLETTTLPGSVPDNTYHMIQQPQNNLPGTTTSSSSSQHVIGGPITPATVHISSRPAPDYPPPPPPTHVTKVKATARVRVEVHTPIPGSVNQENYKTKRRKCERDAEDSFSSSSSSDSDIREKRGLGRYGNEAVNTCFVGNDTNVQSNHNSSRSSQRRHRSSSSDNKGSRGRSSSRRRRRRKQKDVELEDLEDDVRSGDCSQA